MKKTILFIALLLCSFISIAQEQPENEKQDFWVVATPIADKGESILLLSRKFAKKFEVKSQEDLRLNTEYFFVLRARKSERDKNHCSGCTGTVNAQLLDYNVSVRQTRKNVSKMLHTYKLGGNDTD